MDGTSERSEVSIHEARLYKVFLASSGWLTNKDVASLANIAERTARMHTLRLVKLGILDIAEVFPAHRYRLSGMADKRNMMYLQRLEQAVQIFGV